MHLRFSALTGLHVHFRYFGFWEEGTMNRERALKVLLVLVGLLFTAAIYPLVTSVRDGWQANKEDALPMMMSLYFTLGIFLLLAARNPSANRTVIAFAAWSSFAHGAVMAVMSVHLENGRGDLLIAAGVFSIIGATLIVLAPAKQSAEPTSAAGAQ
jgi:Family of unknown function (DUF6632)